MHGVAAGSCLGQEQSPGNLETLLCAATAAAVRHACNHVPVLGLECDATVIG